MREGARSLGRVGAACLVVWLMEVGSYTVPTGFGPALAVAVLFAVLAAYELAIRDAPVGMVAGAVMAVLALVLGGDTLWQALQPPPPTGPLKPAGEPTPAYSCGIKPGRGDLVMLFGGDALIGKGAGPFTPFRVGECPVLSLKRTPKGLSVSDAGFDYDNDVAFLIRNGVYEPQLPLELRVLRPDKSTFILLDHYDQEVIYVRYLNRNAVRIRGRFLCGENPQAVVQDDRILVGGIRIAGITRGQHVLKTRTCALAPPPPPMPVLSRPWPR